MAKRGTTDMTARNFVGKSMDVTATPVEGKNVHSTRKSQPEQVHGQAMPAMGSLKGPDKGKGGGSL